MRPCGGVCVVQGVSADPDKCIAVNPLSVLQGKQLRGGFLGGYRFRLDVPALVSDLSLAERARRPRVRLPIDPR